jgi:adhesin transport system outer membrane protein
MMTRIFRKSAIALLVASAVSGAYAAPSRLEDAASKAVQTNPEVVAKWHQFQASGYERDVTWGRYLPTLDVLFGTGHQRQDNPLYVPPGTRSYNFNTSTITLKQNLFEGFATMNDTARLEHASLVRFYEMLDVSESAALEAARAYIDVWRYRKLVEYAEENYATHRILYNKINERASAGVGRKVDFETAAGRLALAESNLLTETSNLHDVMARYQRIVGELPGDDMAPPPAVLSKGLPKSRGEAIKTGFGQSPQLKAAFENILSAKRNVDVQKAGYYPRVDAYAEHERDKNLNGYTADNSPSGTGRTNISTVGVTLSWNLYRGGQDLARQRKAAEDYNGAKDQREKVCRDLRQNLETAFNDHLRLSEQLKYLDQHQLSTDKEREAFHRQFDIGQRTLLDVLDTENEFYTARRNYVNGENDLLIADAKYQAAAGNLLSTLNLKNLDMTPPKPETTPDEDSLTTCPATAVEPPTIDKEAVFKRAMAKEELTRPQPPAPAPAPVPAPAPKKATKSKAPAKPQ